MGFAMLALALNVRRYHFGACVLWAIVETLMRSFPGIKRLPGRFSFGITLAMQTLAFAERPAEGGASKFERE
jgi:hypothetical protein